MRARAESRNNRAHRTRGAAGFNFLKGYVFLGVKDSRPSLVWMRERRVGIDPHMLAAVLLGATCTSHETHYSCRSLMFVYVVLENV